MLITARLLWRGTSPNKYHYYTQLVPRYEVFSQNTIDRLNILISVFGVVVLEMGVH